MIKVKSGVTPHNLIIAAAAANVGAQMGIDIVITSGTDGTHMHGSKHYTGDALDFRLNGTRTAEFEAKLAARLGKAYQVIAEPSHTHVEFDPAPAGVSEATLR